MSCPLFSLTGRDISRITTRYYEAQRICCIAEHTEDADN